MIHPTSVSTVAEVTVSEMANEGSSLQGSHAIYAREAIRQ